jgi:hypothetical protein
VSVAPYETFYFVPDAKKPSTVNICVQLESGERLVKDFSAENSLRDILVSSNLFFFFVNDALTREYLRGKYHCTVDVEIGLVIVLVYFFPHLNMQKTLLIMGPNNTQNSSLKCDFLIINYE